ncbi:MAG TPA: hypothetical protein VIQ23_08050 [Hanamia sp.]|jgi:hypothetical protein
MCHDPILLINGVKEAVNFLRKQIFTEQLLLDFVLIFCSLIILLIVFILIFLYRKTKHNHRKIFLQKKFNNFLGEIAICESEEELTQVFLHPAHQRILHQFGQNSFDKNLLINELAETSKQFRGSTMDNIQWLFEKMELEKELLKNLNSNKWHKKAKAIQQLAYLHQKNRIEDIFPLVNHKNILVRREAQITIVKFTGFEGLEFLNVVRHPISEWQQLRLIQELSDHTSEKFGNISLWLQSKNESVVNFALHLVEIYRQYDYYDEVKECLSHSSLSICKRAVMTLSHINNETTPDLLIKFFPGYDASLQIEILKILQADGNESHLPFLFSLINHPDDSFKLEAAKAILNINPASIEKMKLLIDEFSYPWNIILPQIKTQTSL